MIGDDEHCWCDDGISNIEGGCYASVANLTEGDEPLIYRAIKRNALLENVNVEENGVVNYASDMNTAYSRVSYPITHIPNRVSMGVAGHPSQIIFLTCDASGVLPPVAKLTANQAVYHYLSGECQCRTSLQLNKRAIAKTCVYLSRWRRILLQT